MISRKQAKPKIESFTLQVGEPPNIPAAYCLCPTCLNPMPVMYWWFSSERVVHVFLICQCGRAAKGKLIHAVLDKNGRAAWS